MAAAVLSGNRNFEGRIQPLVKAVYLASPPLVVAYALAGVVDIDLTTEPLGTGRDGRPVYLRDLWPSAAEVAAATARAVRPELFRARYGDAMEDNAEWNALPVAASELYRWDPASTYIQEPPFLVDLPARPGSDPADPRGTGAAGAGRFGDHRPHFARRGDRRLQPGRPAICRSRASPRWISTATARGAATTG